METLKESIFKDYFLNRTKEDELLNAKMIIQPNWKVLLQ